MPDVDSERLRRIARRVEEGFGLDRGCVGPPSDRLTLAMVEDAIAAIAGEREQTARFRVVPETQEVEVTVPGFGSLRVPLADVVPAELDGRWPVPTYTLHYPDVGFVVPPMPAELDPDTDPADTFEGYAEGHARIDRAGTQTQSDVDRAEAMTIDELLEGIDLALDGWKSEREQL